MTALSNGYIPASFAGFDITDVSENPDFTGISLDSASTFAGPTASFTSDSLSLNLANAGYYVGETAVFDLTSEPSGTGGSTSVTPEPSSIALLGTGLLGVAGMLRRRYV